ncbi:hypothetical protein OEZ86_007453 [Tetradesmus obliquus]|nr:hypothetical protein OEZ86_007453 [Tetradesmus obliquus]
MDLLEALRCQNVYHWQYNSDPNRLRAALGPACAEATLNPIQCCTDSVKLLNGPDLRGCICNHIVYSQLCGQLNVAGQTCDTLLPTLKSCGLQC